MIRDHLPLLAAIGCGACVVLIAVLWLVGLVAVAGAVGFFSAATVILGRLLTYRAPVEPIHEYESEVR
jgi:hypothetical protein